jgi:hypothetical protein
VGEHTGGGDGAHRQQGEPLSVGDGPVLASGSEPGEAGRRGDGELARTGRRGDGIAGAVDGLGGAGRIEASRWEQVEADQIEGDGSRRSRWGREPVSTDRGLGEADRSAGERRRADRGLAEADGSAGENSTERTAAARTGTGDGGQGDLAAAVTSRSRAERIGGTLL